MANQRVGNCLIFFVQMHPQIKLDEEDLSKYALCMARFHSCGYIIVSHEGKDVLLHRLIMNPQEGMEVDHKNQNKLDNRKENLRVVTSSQNKMNRAKYDCNTTGYKGVTRERGGSYSAYIRINNKKYHISSHNLAEEAARAYDRKAKEVYGEFASLNFP